MVGGLQTTNQLVGGLQATNQLVDGLQATNHLVGVLQTANPLVGGLRWEKLENGLGVVGGAPDWCKMISAIIGTFLNGFRPRIH